MYRERFRSGRGKFCLIKMVYTCCVPECRTGYKKQKRDAEDADLEKVPIFEFPKDKDQQLKWLRAIPRDNLTITSSTRVCAKHFYEDDFVHCSTDLREGRKQSRESVTLKVIRLKSNAIPRIFPNVPSYLTIKAPNTRNVASTSVSRLERVNQRIQERNEQTLQQDSISDVSELRSKLGLNVLPSGFVSVDKATAFIFLYVPIIDIDVKAEPKILASVAIDDNLCVTAFVSSTPLPLSMIHPLISGRHIATVTELCNILALCKSLADTASNSNTASHVNYIELAISLLQRYINEDMDSKSPDFCFYPLVKFVIEQLNLCQLSTAARQYLTTTMTTAFLWQMTSTSLYKRLSTLFILPSISRLRQLSRGSSVDTGIVDVSYLRRRASYLNEQQRIVTLLIDEVYTAQRIEYNNGKFIGLTNDGVPAKTVLTFMIQSTCSKYKGCRLFISRGQF